MTMSPSLHHALHGEMFSLVSKNIAEVPGLKRWLPIKLLGRPQYVCAIKYGNKPYGVFLLANPGNGKVVNDKFVRSVLPDIARDYPAIKMVVQLPTSTRITTTSRIAFVIFPSNLASKSGLTTASNSTSATLPRQKIYLKMANSVYPYSARMPRTRPCRSFSSPTFSI